MRILVIEDKQIHQDSARETLTDHDLMIAQSYDDAVDELNRPSFNYEAVLTDMNMPMSKGTLSREAYKPDEQVPYGFVLALLAAHRGAKYVAMVTDTNHHKGAMSNALDKLSPTYYKYEEEWSNFDRVKLFTINGAKCIFVHAPFVKDIIKNAPCDCRDGLCQGCHGTFKDGYGDPCYCTKDENPGKCNECKGHLRFDKKVEERKDWGRVLNDLLSE